MLLVCFSLFHYVLPLWRDKIRATSWWIAKAKLFRPAERRFLCVVPVIKWSIQENWPNKEVQKCHLGSYNQLNHIESKITSTYLFGWKMGISTNHDLYLKHREKTQQTWPGFCEEDIDTGDLSRAGPAYEAMEDKKKTVATWSFDVHPRCGYIEKGKSIKGQSRGKTSVKSEIELKNARICVLILLAWCLVYMPLVQRTAENLPRPVELKVGIQISSAWNPRQKHILWQVWSTFLQMIESNFHPFEI